MTVGEAAAGLAGIDPTRVVRALKRRVGDPDPVILGGHPWAAEDLSARLLRWVVDRVTEHENGPPAGIALAHPRPRGPRTRSSGSPPRSPGRTSVSRSSPSPTRSPPPRPPRLFPVTRSVSTTSAAAGSTRPSCAGRACRPAGSRCWACPGRSPISVASTSTSWSGSTSGPRCPTTCHRSRGSGVRAPGRRRRSAQRTRSSCGSGAATTAAAVRLDRATFDGLIAPYVPDGGHPAPHDRVGRTGARAAGGAAARRRFGPYPARRADRDRAARLRADRARRSGPRRAGAVLALAAPAARGRRRRVRAEGERPPRGRSGRPIRTARSSRRSRGRPRWCSPYRPRWTRRRRRSAHRRTAPRRPGAAASPEPATVCPAPAPRRSPGRGRTAAVLDPRSSPYAGRSLARTLVGVGAVIVVALVLVALFRPDGPLDPPLDPFAGDGASRIAVPVPVAVAPPAGVPIPTAAELDAALEPDRPSGAVRPAAGPPAEPRPSVTTTPPVAPRAMPADVLPTAGSARAGAPRTGMTRRPPQHRSCDPVHRPGCRHGKIHPNGGQPPVTFSPAPAMGGREPAGRTPAQLRVRQ